MSTKIEDKDSSPRCAVSPGSVTYALFKHMFDEHGLTLLESEMSEIVRIVNDNLEARLRWWITNAEDIAKERGELFRAGEAMRAIVMCYAWDCDEVGAWDAAAQPIRDMLSSPNEPDEPQAAANPQRKIFPMTHEKGQAGPVGSMAGSALDRALAYSPGQDCQCSAYGECECRCSAEWTPRINKIVAAWRDMPAAEMRLRCGELKAQEIRTVRAVLNAILASAKDEPRHE
jgi:hypothetical protein